MAIWPGAGRDDVRGIRSGLAARVETMTRDPIIGLEDGFIDRMALLFIYERWSMTFEQYLRLAVRFLGDADQSKED